MKQKVAFAIGILLVVGMLAIVSLKLFVATGHLMIHNKGLKSLLSIPEVMATDQRKTSHHIQEQTPSPTDKEQSEQGKVDAEPMRTAKTNPSAMAETLSYLEQKELELRRKEQRLNEQEKHLFQMQKEVEEKLENLIAVQKDIQSFRNEKNEARNASIRSLAQIYGTMKPKEAAKLLENMDEKLVVSLLSTMKANEAAEILSTMDFKKAAKISEALTQR